jgi:hypothetical protein
MKNNDFYTKLKHTAEDHNIEVTDIELQRISTLIQLATDDLNKDPDKFFVTQPPAVVINEMVILVDYMIKEINQQPFLKNIKSSVDNLQIISDELSRLKSQFQKASDDTIDLIDGLLDD